MLANIPSITDLSKLKITKVKQWAINFDYEDKHYFIHGRYEYGEGSGQDFYERILDENGHYELIHITSKWFEEDNLPVYYIKNYHKFRNYVYNQIDKDFFVKQLTKIGFADSDFVEVVKKEKKTIDDLKEEIKKHQDSITKLRSKISELGGE